MHRGGVYRDAVRHDHGRASLLGVASWQQLGTGFRTQSHCACRHAPRALTGASNPAIQRLEPFSCRPSSIQPTSGGSFPALLSHNHRAGTEFHAGKLGGLSAVHKRRSALHYLCCWTLQVQPWKKAVQAMSLSLASFNDAVVHVAAQATLGDVSACVSQWLCWLSSCSTLISWLVFSLVAPLV